MRCIQCNATEIIIENFGPKDQGPYFTFCNSCKSCGPVCVTRAEAIATTEKPKAKNQHKDFCCPYCGYSELNIAKIDNQWIAECSECGAMGPPQKTKALSREQWRQT